jgi:hypothetical protein
MLEAWKDWDDFRGEAEAQGKLGCSRSWLVNLFT